MVRIDTGTGVTEQKFDLEGTFSKHIKNTRRSIREAMAKYSSIRKTENPQEISDTIVLGVDSDVWSGSKHVGAFSIDIKAILKGSDASGIVVEVLPFGSALGDAIHRIHAAIGEGSMAYYPTVYRSVYTTLLNAIKNMFNTGKVKIKLENIKANDNDTAQALPDDIVKVNTRISSFRHSIDRKAQVTFDTPDGDSIASLMVIINNSGKDGLTANFNITKGANSIINPEVMYRSVRSASGVCDVPMDIIKTGIIARARDAYLGKCKATLRDEYAPSKGFIMAARKRFPDMSLGAIYAVICGSPALSANIKTKA